MILDAIPKGFLMMSAPNSVDRMICARIAGERKRLGLSAATLAVRAGIAGTDLQMAEIGLARLSALNMMRLLRTLEKRPAWLFAGIVVEAESAGS